MNPPNSPFRSTFKDRWLVLLLCLIALSLPPYFIRLGASSLWDSNESFYAETPREMLESGDLVNPSFNYQPRFNKPPLSYWLVAFFYRLFGASEAVERLVIVAAAIVMMVTAYWLARVAFSHEAGLLAAVGLAVSPRLLMFSRRITIDVYLSMFMSLALLFFAIAEIRPRQRRRYLSLMYVSLGLGLMTKGPVALLLPALVFLVYLLATRQVARIRELMIPAGILIIAIIVVPWYWAVYAQHGWKYIETFLFDDNLSRYAEYSWGPKRGFIFYVRVLLGDMFPWSVILVPAFWFGLKRRQTADVNAAPKDWIPAGRTPILYVMWVAVIVIFFSFSKSKEDLYIMPAYPAASALAGGLVSTFLSNRLSSSVKNLSRIMLAAGGFLLCVAGAVGMYIFAYRTSPYTLAGAAIIGCFAIIGGAAVMFAASMGRGRTAVVALIGAVLLSDWVFVLRTLPDFERYKPVRALCQSIDDLAPPNALVGYYKYASPSMVFYLRRPIFEYYEPEEMRRAFATGKQIFCVITEADYAHLRKYLPETRVLASRPVFRVKLKSILDRVEPPQVLLISNRLEQSDTQ
jgi:4-amino-4-deoxy-L-arabinose transferase-like glycosyltransferase